MKLKLVTNKENIYPNQFFRFADRTRSERTQPETVSVKKEESDAANVLQPKSGGRLESTSTIRCGCTVYQRLQEPSRQVLGRSYEHLKASASPLIIIQVQVQVSTGHQDISEPASLLSSINATPLLRVKPSECGNV